MSLAEEPNAAGVHARVADRFAEHDARRSAQLTALCKFGERYLRETEGSLPLEPLPGERAALEVKGFAPGAPPHDPIKLPVRPAPEIRRPTPAPKETTMPSPKSCSRCGKSLRADNTRGVCGQMGPCTARMKAKGGSAAAPQAKAKTPAPPRGTRARPAVSRELEAATVDQLVAQRAAALAGVAAIDAELRRRRDAIAEALSGESEAA